MKCIEAKRILDMMDDNTEVELIFPDAVSEIAKPKKPQLTEGAMAMLPMQNSSLIGWQRAITEEIMP